MKIAIIGGNLQGLEAAYLSKKAGYEVVVIDRHPDVAASFLGDRFIRVNIGNTKQLDSILKNIDIVLPALENHAALKALGKWSQNAPIPVLFDFEAFNISASKIKSNTLFETTAIPYPTLYPQCGFPVIIKPDSGSGSRGVNYAPDRETLDAILKDLQKDIVVQKYLSGPIYSIEIMGHRGAYHPFQITELQMDQHFDCKRVLAPADLPPPYAAQFENIAIKAARVLGLNGLMDIEAIADPNGLSVLEIDARLPSQTPTAVFWSTGINMLETVVNQYFNKGRQKRPHQLFCKGVIYEHIAVKNDTITVMGEHIISGADSLRIEKDFYGADEAITNQAENRNMWVATLIISAETRAAAWKKRTAVISDLKRHFNIGTVIESVAGFNFEE